MPFIYARVLHTGNTGNTYEMKGLRLGTEVGTRLGTLGTITPLSADTAIPGCSPVRLPIPLPAQRPKATRHRVLVRLRPEHLTFLDTERQHVFDGDGFAPINPTPYQFVPGSALKPRCLFLRSLPCSGPPNRATKRRRHGIAPRLQPTTGHGRVPVRQPKCEYRPQARTAARLFRPEDKCE